MLVRPKQKNCLLYNITLVRILRATEAFLYNLKMADSWLQLCIYAIPPISQSYRHCARKTETTWKMELVCVIKYSVIKLGRLPLPRLWKTSFSPQQLTYWVKYITETPPRIAKALKWVPSCFCRSGGSWDRGVASDLLGQPTYIVNIYDYTTHLMPDFCSFPSEIATFYQVFYFKI